MPPTATVGQVKLENQLRNSKTAEDRAGTTKERFAELKRQYDAWRASSAPGGWEADIDPKTGAGPSKENKDGSKFTAVVMTNGKIQAYLDDLGESLAKGGSNDPADPEFQNQRQIISNIQSAMKERNNFGAALTDIENKINNGMLPRILARPDIGVGAILIEEGLGRDPIEAIDNLKKILDQEVDVAAKTYKFKRKAENSDNYSPNVAEERAKALTSDTQSEPDPEKDPEGYKAWYKNNVLAKKAAVS